MLAFSNDYYGMIFRATQSVELFCAYRLVNQIEKRGISYENTAHRNFRFIILIISQEDCFSETTDYLNNLISHKNLSFISIESMKEEQLFSE